MRVNNTPTLPSLNQAVLFPFDECSMPFTRDLHMTLLTGRKMPDEVDWGANIVMDERQPNGPVMTEGQPGDPDSTEVICPNVFFIDGEYRMWYLGAGDNRRRNTGLYAVSKDGFHWEKPKLGLTEYNGNKQNNLVEGPCGEWMFYDPEDPNPDRRFKSLRMGREMRSYVSFSRDGLHWKPGPEDIFGIGCELGHVFRFNGCFYANGQGGPAPINRPIPPPPGSPPKRIMITYASYDFERWTHAAAMSFRRDPLPPRVPTDFEPHRGEQVHEGAATWDRGNVLIGFYGQYHCPSNDRAYYVADLGLIVSHDALHFKEPVPDFKMVHSYEERGGGGELLLQRNAFANIGDRTVYWYSLGRTGNPVWSNQQPTGVRVATWVRDRLGSFSPCRPNHGLCGEYDPHCISCPIEATSPGTELFINADGLGQYSQLQVELLDLRFRPIPGYSGDDCVPLSESGLRQPVRWRNQSSLARFDHPIRVRINWRGIRPEDAQLYAVYVEEHK